MAKNFPAPAKLRGLRRAGADRQMKFDDGMRSTSWPGLLRADDDAGVQGAAPRVFRRARRQQDPRCAGKHPAARHCQGGGHRRRHHGRRHQHELPERRHPGDHPGDEAGRAGPRRGHHQEELRGPGQEGQAEGRQVPATHGAAEHHAELRRHQGCRPGHRSGVRRDRREGKGVQGAGRGDETRRHPGQQHVHPGCEPNRLVHQAPAGRGGPALLQPRQRDEAAGGGAWCCHRQGRAGHGDGSWPRRSARPRWCPACATASSATA